MKRLAYGAILALLLLGGWGQHAALSQSGPTPASPQQLTGFAGPFVKGLKSGGPENVPFENDPFIVSGLDVEAFLEVLPFDVAKHNPASGCSGIFGSVPNYQFNLREPLKQLTVSFQIQTQDTKAALVVRMPDQQFYCSGAPTTNPSVTISGDMTSGGVSVWIGFPPAVDHALGSLSISANGPSAGGSASASSPTASPAAQTQAGAILGYGKPVTGTINDNVTQIPYRFGAKKGDVIVAHIVTTSAGIATQQAGTSPQPLDANIIILDPQGKEIADSYGGGKDTFLANSSATVFAVADVRGTYSVVATRGSGSHLSGDFKLTATVLDELKPDQPVSGKIAVSDFTDNTTYGALYAVQSAQDFTLTYHKTDGAFAPTLLVSQVEGKDPNNLVSPIGRLQTLAGIVGPYTTFNLIDTKADQGGSLFVAGSTAPYVISIGNNLENFDSLFFVKDKSPDASAAFDLSYTVAGSAAPAVVAPTIVPAATTIPPTIVPAATTVPPTIVPAASPTITLVAPVTATTAAAVNTTPLLDTTGSYGAHNGSQWFFATPTDKITITIDFTNAVDDACPVDLMLVNAAKKILQDLTIKPGLTHYAVTIKVPNAGSYTAVVGGNSRPSACRQNAFKIMIQSAS